MSAEAVGEGFFGKVYPAYSTDVAKEPQHIVKISVHEKTDFSLKSEAEVLSNLGRESFAFEMDDRSALFIEWQPGKALSSYTAKELVKIPLHIRMQRSIEAMQTSA